MTTRARAGSVLCAALVVLTACGSSIAKSAGPDSAAPREITASATTAAGSVAAGGAGTGAGATGQPVDAAPSPVVRKVVVTITLEVDVKDVSASAAQAQTLAEGAGGYVFSQQAALGDRPTATLVLKVPPDKAGGLLDLLGTLGKVQSRTQQADDVTAQFVDLDARITTARTSVERLRGFLDKATTVTDLATLEAELTRRQTELEQLIGQQRVLSSKADLATITLTLNPTAAVLAKAAKHDPSIGHALHKGAHALVVFVHWIGVIAAFLLPWLAPLAVALLIAWPFARRRKQRRAKRTLPPPSVQP